MLLLIPRHHPAEHLRHNIAATAPTLTDDQLRPARGGLTTGARRLLPRGAVEQLAVASA